MLQEQSAGVSIQGTPLQLVEGKYQLTLQDRGAFVPEPINERPGASLEEVIELSPRTF